jgi:hypothetical protein
VLSAWIADQAPLGHKAPRPGFARLRWCPVCLALEDKRVRLSCVHVLVSCPGVRAVRDRACITGFLASCREGGLSSLAAYSAFLNGKEADGITSVSLEDHLVRAESLLELQVAWVAIWDGVRFNYPDVHF